MNRKHLRNKSNVSHPPPCHFLQLFLKKKNTDQGPYIHMEMYIFIGYWTYTLWVFLIPDQPINSQHYKVFVMVVFTCSNIYQLCTNFKTSHYTILKLHFPESCLNSQYRKQLVQMTGKDRTTKRVHQIAILSGLEDTENICC